MELSVDIKGVKTIVDRLSHAADKVQRREARRAAFRGARCFAMRRGATPSVSTIRRHAKKIAKNIAMQQSRRQSKAAGGIVMRVGVAGRARARIKGSGAPRVAIPTTGASSSSAPAKMRPRPFMRPAFDGQ